MRIGVVSDTHNVLRPEVIASLRGCDYILHAGDLCCEELLMQLKARFVLCAAIMILAHGPLNSRWWKG